MASPRPMVDKKLALQLLLKHYPIGSVEETSVKELPSYDDRNFYLCASMEQRVSTEEVSRQQFVLKVCHEKFSGDEGLLDAQEAVMEHLSQRGFMCPVALATRNGQLHAFEDLAHPLYSEPPRSAIRLLRFVPGQTVAGCKPLSDDLLYSIGGYVARLHNTLEEFKGTACEAAVRQRGYYCWSIANALDVGSYLPTIPDNDVRQSVSSVLDMFRQHILPVMEKFRSGVIHGDVNEFNLLTDAEKPHTISGILDFNDIVYAPYVGDLGVSLAYLMLVSKGDPASSTLPIIRGYVAERQLEPVEQSTLLYWALARLAQTIGYSFDAYSKDPENKYIMASCQPATKVLQKLFQQNIEKVHDQWASAACFSKH